MTARYSHLNPEYLGTAASKLDEVFTDPLTLGQGDPKEVEPVTSKSPKLCDTFGAKPRLYSTDCK